jgi:hypothetical protein
MSAAKKTAEAKADKADAIIETQSAEQKRWANSSFTDDELVVILATLTKTAPKSGKAPKDILDRVMAVAKRQGVTVSDAKEIMRRAMTPGDAKAAPTKAGAKPQPARAPVKDSPKQREPGQPPKHPAPEKKKASAVVSTGQTKPQIILNAIRAPKGASLTALMGLTGWQAHSVRGCIATLKTQQGYGIDSEKVGTERMYRLTSEPKAQKQAAAAQRRKPAPRVTAKAVKKPTRKSAAAKRKAG